MTVGITRLSARAGKEVSVPAQAGPVDLGCEDAGAASPHSVHEASRRVQDRPACVASPRVCVGPFQVVDTTARDVLATLVAEAGGSRPYLAYALHVGGLNARKDDAYIQAMSGADLVYADGVSIVLLARIAGARNIERAPTTDLGWALLRELREALGRPVRVALVGGADGRSREAGEVLQRELGIEVVAAESGYQSDWRPCLSRLVESQCDVLFVGLGAPGEMKWVYQHRSGLPPCLVLTCGGWFGFVVSEEKRAPDWMRRSGAEWCFRLAQAPRRLGRRYACGAWVCAVVACSTSIARCRAALPTREESMAGSRTTVRR